MQKEIGPRNYQTINSKMMDNCGVYGENAVHLLSVLGHRKVNESKCYSMDEDKKVNTFSKQIEYWMDYVIPGIEINTDDMTELRISKMSLQLAGRLVLSYLLGIVFDFGVIGLALAMACDWSIRAVIFVWRQRSGIWKKFQVI